MALKIFSNSTLQDVTLLGMSCKKLETPEKETPLNINLIFQVSLEKVEKGNNYTILMSTNIEGKFDGDKKAFSLEYNVRATYGAVDTDDINDESITREIKFFFHQIYLLTRDDINNLLNKMRIKFQIPFKIPDDLKINTNDVTQKKTKGKK